MRAPQKTTALFLALALATVGLTPSCSSFRALMRDWSNAELLGEEAPPLSAGTWVDGPAPELAGDWYLVAFLKPT